MHKVLLCILDGFGHGKDYKGNALTRAKTPFFDELYKKYPWTLLNASGEAVGIPKGTQGGSEVGHLTMGAGRIVLQPLLQIDKAIEDGSFFKKKALLAAAAHAKKHKSAFHILGMISDQGVHADLDHALALLDFAKKQGLKKVFVHGITDGRDVQPQSAITFIRTLQKHMKKSGVGDLASLVGRYYAMDRDKNWDRTQVAYDLYTTATPVAAIPPSANAATNAVEAAYKGGLESDYYLKPVLLNPAGIIQKKDAVVFFNFRTDRAAQLTELFTKKLKPHFVAFGPYTSAAPVVFPETKIKNNLGSVLDQKKLKQLRIAETEKYAHVSFFFNSQAKEPFKTETRILVDSPKCPSYAEKPEMSAEGITKKLLKELPKDYAFTALNFANLDLVGHSGDFKATVKAVEVIDHCLAQIIPAALATGHTILITGDHGNAEYMIYEDTGGPCPSHTRNPVPLILVSNSPLSLKKSSHQKATGGLKDIAPTVLSLLDLKVPPEMTGNSLV
ncbi:MAG: 2,3-bisphosphoglycerate-independent phosphoglycerate mutase [Candidatus Gracilibacteria bacterium]|jgi:2,3-bisphosphoglycerate-independent phosphoglycerate mutase